MPFEIVLSENFERQIKQLSKKYRSIEDDILALIDDLEINPKQGEPLGLDCYKIQLKIASKNTGKRDGGRVISCVKIVDEQITLLALYDKSEQDTIKDKDLKILLKKVFGD